MHICKIAYGAQVLVTQSCLTLCDCMEPTRLLCPWNSPGTNTRVGSHSLLQGNFPIQGSNPGFVHCRQTLYQLSHEGSPKVTLFKYNHIYVHM